MVKAKLPEIQSPGVKVSAHRKKRLITGANLCARMNRRADAPSQGRPLTNEAKQGDEWDT
jgi:hypothetical protein